MPKVSVYLPDELYRAARARGLRISALAQQAIEQALRGEPTDAWVARVRARPPRVTVRLDVLTALEEAREGLRCVIVLDAAALVDVVLDQPAGGWVLDRLGGKVCAPA
jgi:hypothetical protein